MDASEPSFATALVCAVKSNTFCGLQHPQQPWHSASRSSLWCTQPASRARRSSTPSCGRTSLPSKRSRATPTARVRPHIESFLFAPPSLTCHVRTVSIRGVGHLADCRADAGFPLIAGRCQHCVVALVSEPAEELPQWPDSRQHPSCSMSALWCSSPQLAVRQLLSGCCIDQHAEAKHLSALQADVVEVDATDLASLRSAFEGAYGVFALTVTLHGPPTAQEEFEAEVRLGASQPSQVKC
jgi:hypothetical protein